MTSQALALLILLFPAAGAILLAGRGWRFPRIFTVIVGPGVVWLSFLAVLWLFFGKLTGDFTYWTWIKSGSFEVPFNLLVDNLSLFMCLVITGVGGLIVTYSVGYMEHEDGPSYARFFCYMDVFIFSMLLLVLAGNFVFLIIGWAMVGLSSYLLIGFWYQRRSRGAGRPQGVRDERHRRCRHDPRRVRPVRPVPDARLPGSFLRRPVRTSGFRNLSSLPKARPRAGGVPAAGRCGRQVRAASAPHLAARCHGGSDAVSAP